MSRGIVSLLLGIFLLGALPASAAPSAQRSSEQGLAAFQQGRYQDAIDAFERAVRIRAEKGDRVGEARDRNNLARLYVVIGDYSAALAQAEAALGLAAKLDNAALTAQSLTNRGLVYLNQRSYRQAAADLDQAASLGTQASRAEALTVLGAVYRQQGDFERAIAAYERSLAMDLDARAQATNLRVLGEAHLHRMQGEKNENLQLAQKYLEQALEQHRAQHDDLSVAMALSHLGELAHEEKRDEEAIEQYRRALKTFSALDYPDGVGRMHIHLGFAHGEAGRPAEAIAHFDEALAIYRELGDPEWQRVALYGKALYLERMGKLADAEKYYKQAVAVFESIRGDVVGGEAAEDLFTEVNSSLYENLVALLVKQGDVEGALEYVERSRLRALRDFLLATRGPERKRGENTLGTLAQLTRSQTALREQRSRTSDPKLRARYAATLAQNEREAAKLVLQLKQRYRGMENTLDIVPNTRAFRHSPQFPADLALLTFFTTPQHLYIFVVKKGAQVVVKQVPVTERTLSDQTAAALLLIGERRGTPFPRRRLPAGDALVDALRALYDTLIAPVQDELRGAGTIAILPVKWLNYLPFEALLPASTDGRLQFWLERKRLVYLSAQSYADALFGPHASRRPDIASIAAFGNPDLGDRRLALPYASVEVRDIARRFPDSAVYVGADATKANFNKQWGRHQLIHLAAHARLDEEQAEILLAPGKGGVLRIDELFDLPANQRTELIVLSACQSAVDPKLARILWRPTAAEAQRRLSPSGAVTSVAHSLLLLGIPAVTATLWKIDDQATAVLMSYFYQHLGAGSDAHTALHRAQQNMLARQDNYSQPYYWAGFVFYGAVPMQGQ